MYDLVWWCNPTQNTKMEFVALNVQLPGIMFPNATSSFSEKHTKLYSSWILGCNERSQILTEYTL